jgi:hypothetical protein
MESLRERRLAFRRQNTIKNGRSSSNQQPQFVPPTHPVRFQDRKNSRGEEKCGLRKQLKIVLFS